MRVCAICSTEFDRKGTSRKYCGEACRLASERVRDAKRRAARKADPEALERYRQYKHDYFQRKKQDQEWYESQREKARQYKAKHRASKPKQVVENGVVVRRKSSHKQPGKYQVAAFKIAQLAKKARIAKGAQ